MKKIKLTKGKVALIDNEDFEMVNKWKWSFNGSYAVRGEYLGRVDGKDKYKRIYLHRVINKTPLGLETDHINKNKLDNRRKNLRSVTKGINNNNRDAYKNNLTGVSCVSFLKKLNKYRVRVTVDKKVMNLGYYSNIKEAIKVRNNTKRIYAI